MFCSVCSLGDARTSCGPKKMPWSLFFWLLISHACFIYECSVMLMARRLT